MENKARKKTLDEDKSPSLVVLLIALSGFLMLMIISLFLPKHVQDQLFRLLLRQKPDQSFNYIDVGLYKTRHSMYRKEIFSAVMRKRHLLKQKANATEAHSVALDKRRRTGSGEDSHENSLSSLASPRAKAFGVSSESELGMEMEAKQLGYSDATETGNDNCTKSRPDRIQVEEPGDWQLQSIETAFPQPSGNEAGCPLSGIANPLCAQVSMADG
ncbi:unnamed protein product [Protopolystoma xenopodis]|uniref:Uncharacterized protein n=1 Tax=Protopolystoma xenopodis TaxID=117903 RepID=A0A448X470_9PLAT|nr:unnamed protein product [Protopolystoma xenopodis]